MGVFDRFMDAIRINNDDYEDDEFYDDEDELEDDDYDDKPKKGFFKRILGGSDDDYDDDLSDSRSVNGDNSKAKSSSFASSNKVTPLRRRSNKNMEVRVVKPSSMEDTRDIADTLLSGSTVILNLEGMDVELAQRVIDFSCGSCYTINGSLQQISSYIFILTPHNVGISGDIIDILNGSIPTMSSKV